MKGTNCQFILHLNKTIANRVYLSEARNGFLIVYTHRLHSLRSLSLGLSRVSLRGCKVSIQRVVSDGCRVRPSWPYEKNFIITCLRYDFVAIRQKKIISTSLRPWRLCERNKKPASAAWGKASDLRLGWVGIPLVCVDREQPWLQATSANVGVGFIPIHQAQQRLTASERLVLRNPRLSERSECSLG